MLERNTSAFGKSVLLALDVVSIAQALLVAEYLSFRQAAKTLGVRQSVVSRRIRSLEDVLGVSLFERHHAGVRVTAAGAQFFERVRCALAEIDHAAKIAETAGRGENGHLRIGLYSSLAAGFVRDLIGLFRDQHPDVALTISEISAREYLPLIGKRGLDIAFAMNATAIANCETTPLWTERLFAVLPQGHPLCAREEIDWEVLGEERFIIRESDPGPAMHDYLARRFASLGRIPSMQKFDVGREACMQLVALGLGITVTSEATTANCFPGVVFRPIAGSSGIVRFSGIWSPKNDNPAFRRFLSLARALSKKRNNGASDTTASPSVEPMV